MKSFINQYKNNPAELFNILDRAIEREFARADAIDEAREAARLARLPVELREAEKEEAAAEKARLAEKAKILNPVATAADILG